MSININPAHRGMLHRAMGVSEDKPLSIGAILKTKARAKKSGNGKLEKEANFAAVARKWNHGG